MKVKMPFDISLFPNAVADEVADLVHDATRYRKVLKPQRRAPQFTQKPIQADSSRSSVPEPQPIQGALRPVNTKTTARGMVIQLTNGTLLPHCLQVPAAGMACSESKPFRAPKDTSSPPPSEPQPPPMLREHEGWREHQEQIAAALQEIDEAASQYSTDTSGVFERMRAELRRWRDDALSEDSVVEEEGLRESFGRRLR